MTTLARKGRRRRYQEARELKHSFDDSLFAESDATLADLYRSDPEKRTNPDTEREPDVYESDGLPPDGAAR